MADGRHLGKIEKLLYLSRCSSDFDKIWHADAVRFFISKIQDGSGRHLEKSKNSHISAAVQPILTKFGTMMQSTLVSVPTVKNLKFQKSTATGIKLKST